MAKQVDFLQGKIMRTLFSLALPIMMTYFVQTAYSLIDMIWIGRLGSAAVAGVCGVSADTDKKPKHKRRF
jgi:Na+-driven multidrug efflux pump